jgi:hypothetical protein
MLSPEKVQEHYRAITAMTGIEEGFISQPFTGQDKPTQIGFYFRVSAKTGDLVVSKWTGAQWGKYSDTMQRAEQRAYSRSRYQELPWYGRSQNNLYETLSLSDTAS